MDSATQTHPSISAPEVPTLDARGLQPPEPILLILKKVSSFTTPSSIRVKLDQLPMHLYDLLSQRGFVLDAKKIADGSYEGLVTPRPSEAH